MAKPTRSSGNSKIRFVFLEADVDGANLSEITAAIQNALAPRTRSETRLVQVDALPRSSALPHPDLDVVEDETGIDEPVRSARPTPAKRSFAVPKVVELDPKADPTLEKFFVDCVTKNTNDKYLAVLGWFKETGKDAATTNEVYTAFRKLKWSTAVKDFSQPLRDLKVQQLVTGSSKEGFTINHIGIDRVENMKSRTKS